MTPQLQLFMVLGALMLLCIIFTLLKRGLMSVKYSLLWLLLAVALVIAAAFPYVIYVLRDVLSIEMPVNLVFLLMFCFVLVVLLFTFKSAGMPVLLILVIQGSIWINFSMPYILDQPLFFMSYLVVSSIQMGANIDYAIVVANRYQELKGQMHHRDAIIETMNFAFPTIITSGTILAVAGTLIGLMTSTPSITGIGQNLGRGTIISILLVMFVLPQILLVGGKIVDMTAFEMPNVAKKHSGRGRVRVDGMVQGEIRGTVIGIVHAAVDGEVDLNLISGAVSEEDKDEAE